MLLLHWFTSSVVYVLGVPPGNLDLRTDFRRKLFQGFFSFAAFSAVGIFVVRAFTRQIVAYLLGVCSISSYAFWDTEQFGNFKLLGGADYLQVEILVCHHFILALQEVD